MNTPSPDASNMINTTKEVFATHGAIGRNGCLDSYGEDQIAVQNDEVFNAHAHKRTVPPQPWKNAALLKAAELFLKKAGTYQSTWL